MRYRLYQPGDFAALYAIEEACFQPPLRFPRAYMQRLVSEPESATWIAEDDLGMAGFAIVEWSNPRRKSAAYIQTIEVSPGRRRQGIGAELLRRVESSALAAEASLIWLHADAENHAAIRLYEARGYLYKGREEGYYPNHRPAVVYSKPLTTPEP